MAWAHIAADPGGGGGPPGGPPYPDISGSENKKIMLKFIVADLNCYIVF